jgi:hypothetical protein
MCPPSEDGNRSDFRNVFFSSFLKIKDDGHSPKTPIILSVISRGMRDLAAQIKVKVAAISSALQYKVH